MRNKITRNQAHSESSPTQKERWPRWKRFAGTLAVCAAAGLLASCGTQDRNYRRVSSAVMELQRDPDTREALLEWISLAENTEADAESRIKAKGSLVNAALGGELSQNNLELVFGFLETNADNEVEEIALGCTHAIGILGQRNPEYTDRSLIVLERVLDGDYEDGISEAISRLRDIATSENGLLHVRRIAGLLEGVFDMPLNPDISEKAVLAMISIGEDEGVRDLDREEIIDALFRAARTFEHTICLVWYGLEDICSIDNIDPGIVLRVEQESGRILWTYEDAPCSDWFSE